MLCVRGGEDVRTGILDAQVGQAVVELWDIT